MTTRDTTPQTDYNRRTTDYETAKLEQGRRVADEQRTEDELYLLGFLPQRARGARFEWKEWGE